MDESQCNYLIVVSERSLHLPPPLKEYILYDSMYIKFQKP